jgi:hypothetical protein
MKKQFAIVAGIAMIALAFSSAAWAQNDVTNEFKSNIPEDFQAGGTTLSAGEYTFNVDPVTHTVQIIQVSTMHSIFLNGAPADASANSRPDLTFVKVGDTYHLTGIKGDSFGIKFTSKPATQEEMGAVTQQSRTSEATAGGAR